MEGVLEEYVRKESMLGSILLFPPLTSVCISLHFNGSRVPHAVPELLPHSCGVIRPRREAAAAQLRSLRALRVRCTGWRGVK